MVKEGFKQTEIGWIPEDWEVDIIQNISNRIGDGIHTTPSYKDNEDCFFVNGNNLKNGRVLIDENTKTISLEQFKIHKRDLSNRTILLSINGTIGNVAFFRNEQIVLGKSACYINLKNIVEKDFIYFLLQSTIVQKYFEENLTGSTIKNLGLSTINCTKIPLPPLPEQKAIAEALSDADAWIENLEQCIAKKRLIKQGAMQDLLKPKEDWEVKKLGEVAKVIGGGTPSTFISEFWNGEIEWFTPTEVGYSKYLKSSKRKITKAGLANSSATILPAGTLLLTSRACIGDIGILTSEASTNQGFQSLIVTKENSNEFIYYLMLTKTNELLQNASGSTFLEISPNKVKAIELCIPSLDEQTSIANILSDLDNEIESLENKLEKARQIKQGMMQELLTGRVRLVS